MLPALGDIMQVEVWCQDQNQGAVNVRHYQVGAVSGLGASDQDMANFFDAQLSLLYIPCLHNAALYKGVRVRRIRPLPLTFPADSTLHSGLGTGGAGAAPLQVSGLITLQSPFSGRAFRGRVYVPFPSVVNVSATGHPSVGYIGALDNLALALIGNAVVTVGPDSSTLIPIIFHRATSTGTVVVARKTRAGWATQRRRGDFGRPNASPI